MCYRPLDIIFCDVSMRISFKEDNTISMFMTDKIIEMNKDHKAAKHIAVLLSVLMISVMLLSALYVISETNHDCCGDGCPICTHIDQCKAVLRSAGEGTAALSLAILFTVIVSELFIMADRIVFLPTLITQKIRLNN